MKKLIEIILVSLMLLFLFYVIGRDLERYKTAPCESFNNMESLGFPDRCIDFSKN